MNKEYFVVQRCWHSSPKQIQPLDYLRLFESQHDAEEAAFHSAAAWSRHHNGKESVKTLLLPAYPAHKNTASYGFIANGSLFWVRSLIGYSHTHSNTMPDTQAHVIVTEGVIGGTGNRNSRRGTEAHEGRAFVGSDMSAQCLASQACSQVAANLPQGCRSEVVTVPIGKPLEYASQSFLQNWPAQVLENNNMLLRQECKRESHWIGMDDAARSFSEQPTKRRKFCEDPGWWRLPDAATVSEEEIMQTC